MRFRRHRGAVPSEVMRMLDEQFDRGAQAFGSVFHHDLAIHLPTQDLF
jgi:hypothetical protein